MLKLQHLIYRLILIILFTSSISHAELVKPNTGPLERFKNMIKGQSYQMLLNHIEHDVVEIESNDSIAIFEVTVLDKGKAYYKFNWQVEKYTLEGPLKDCWLTTMVSAPMPLGSSI